MKGVFLYNPKSGRGRVARKVEEILAIFGEHGYHLEPRVIRFDEELFATGEEPEVVVVAGGDGTVNHVVNQLKRAGLNPLLGVLPAGTANDFAGTLGLSHHLLTAARQVASGVEVAVDCGRVNGLYFVNIFSFGVFTTTSQRTPTELKQRIGKLAYLIEGMKEFAELNTLPLQVRADGRTFHLDSLLVLVFNGATAGGFHFMRRTSLTDGLFDVLILEKRNIFRSSWAMWHHLMGGKSKTLHTLKVRDLYIESAESPLTDVDGQPGASLPAHIECVKGGLRLLCPRAWSDHVSSSATPDTHDEAQNRNIETTDAV